MVEVVVWDKVVVLVDAVAEEVLVLVDAVVVAVEEVLEEDVLL